VKKKTKTKTKTKKERKRQIKARGGWGRIRRWNSLLFSAAVPLSPDPARLYFRVQFLIFAKLSESLDEASLSIYNSAII